MKVWGLLLCVVLVATVTCVVAAPEGELPTAEEVPTGETPMDVMTPQRSCTASWCNNTCRNCFRCIRGSCTGIYTCTCYC